MARQDRYIGHWERPLSVALAHLRRLVASLMLAAMASFVLHGAAMAGSHAHQVGSAQCQPGAAHAHPARDHGDGMVHVHVSDVGADVAGHDHGGGADRHADGSEGPCCTGVCSMTLAGPAIAPVSAPMRLASALEPESQRGNGIDGSSLKRPPRTPSIA